MVRLLNHKHATLQFLVPKHVKPQAIQSVLSRKAENVTEAWQVLRLEAGNV